MKLCTSCGSPDVYPTKPHVPGRRTQGDDLDVMCRTCGARSFYTREQADMTSAQQVARWAYQHNRRKGLLP